MSYEINRFSSNFNTGSWPLTVNAGDINGSSTSLKIIGRSVPNYGQYIAENFLHLLENFAGPDAPTSPIAGQLWYKKNPTGVRGEVRVYNGNTSNPGWDPVSVPVGTMMPYFVGNGDLNRNKIIQQGFLPCDGSQLQTNVNPQYAELASIISSGTLPDLQSVNLIPGDTASPKITYIIKY